MTNTIKNKKVQLIDPYNLLGEKALVLRFDQKHRGYFHLIDKTESNRLCGIRGDSVIDLGFPRISDEETLIPLISAREKPLTN